MRFAPRTLVPYSVGLPQLLAYSKDTEWPIVPIESIRSSFGPFRSDPIGVLMTFDRSD
jgi:hypothetical protein